MVFEASWYQISNGASGVLFMALGLLVGRVRAGGAANRAFAVFAISFGAGVFVLNLVLPGHPIASSTSGERAAMILASLLWLGAAVGLAWLAFAALRGSIREHRGWVIMSALVAIGHIGLGQAVALTQLPAADGLFFVSFQILQGSMWGLCVLFAGRFLHSSEKDAAGYALMSAALALYPAFWGTIQFALSVWVNAALEITALGLAFFLGPALVIACVWSYVFLRASGPRARMARVVVWLCLGSMLAGLLAARSADGSEHWGYGAFRFLAVGLLAFAIVRGQAPGIDGRLRFGVSRSAIAGAFITAFFVVSEGAQIVLGQDSPMLGLFAAGALVFVLSPLQRAAERLAEKAVPTEDPATTMQSEPRAHAAYRRALTLALKDRRLSPEEELQLAQLADDLGLGAGTALTLRQEVEAGLEGAP